MRRRTRHLTLTMITTLAALVVAGAALAESPYDRGLTGVGAIATSAQAPDAFERAAIRATATQAPAGSVLSAPAKTGFQWGDASLGAGAVLGMVLVAGLVGLTIRRRGGPVSA